MRRDLAVVGIENHHRLWVAAGGKKNVILGIHCQLGACATFIGKIMPRQMKAGTIVATEACGLTMFDEPTIIARPSGPMILPKLSI